MGIKRALKGLDGREVNLEGLFQDNSCLDNDPYHRVDINVYPKNGIYHCHVCRFSFKDGQASYFHEKTPLKK
jgi:hypothetical protein